MSEHPERAAELSPADKRALLARLLREKAARTEARHPLSYGQRALWFVHRLAPSSPAYNVVYAARIPTVLDVPALRRAFQTLVERHAALRTTFATENGSAVQVVHGYQEVSFTQLDAAGWHDDQVRAALTASSQRPFDLETGPLLRVELYSRSAREHFLLITIHHIVSDSRSFDVLLNELTILYAAAGAGVSPALEPANIQYTDYVTWQESMLSGPDGTRLAEYWRSALADKVVPLDLPTDRTRPPERSDMGGSVEFELAGGVLQQLQALARTEATTLYTLLLAAFQVLLHRYAGQNEILVGSPTAGRTRGEFDGVVGYFVNPVVLHANFSDGPTFRELLARTRRTVQDAIEHQDYPFVLVAKDLAIERDTSRAPIFQVAFDFQKVARKLSGRAIPSNEADPGLVLEPILVEQSAGEYDLVLHVFETPEKIVATINYSADLFERETITRMQDSFVALLEGIVANPDGPVATLPILNPTERAKLLINWNQTAVYFPADSCFHELFEAQVARSPEARALMFEKRTMTYAELNRSANRLARFLQRKSVRAGDLVGISVERGLAMVIAVLGVMKAGAAYVPFDPTYPPERLAYMLRDSRASLVLTQAHLMDKLGVSQENVVCLDDEWDNIADESDENLALGLSSEQPAYAIYTSGSTGKPKGALLRHRGLCNLAAFQRRTFNVGAGDRVLQFSSFSFDAWVWEMAMALGSGATLHLAQQDRLVGSLERVLREAGITIATLPPSALLALPSTELPALRILVAAGEACPHELVEKWARGRQFFNAYGPTEATVCATLAECPVEDPSPPTIGHPISNFEAYVLDAHLQPVPVGVPGELYLGGVGLAVGYLNQPDLTAERFIPNPFGSDPEARLYRTGDLVRYLADGRIDYIGRVDRQVKLRGFRIELGEIETVLAQHPSVRTAAVDLETGHSDKRLIAYLVPIQVPPPSVTQLRVWLQARLPAYLIPSAFVWLDALPLLSNGKVNRAALSAAGGALGDSPAGYLAPATPTEQALVQIWQEVLERPQVSVLDNFFEVGGHSLLATRVLSRLRQTCGVEIPLRRFLQAQNLRELADYVETVNVLQPNALPAHADSEREETVL